MKRISACVFSHALMAFVLSWLLTGCSGLGPMAQSGGNSSGNAGSGNGGNGSGSGNPPSTAEFVYSIVGSSLSGFSLGHDGKLQVFPTVSPNAILNTRRLVISPDSKWLFTVSGCPPSTFQCSGRGAVFSQSIGPDGKLRNPETIIPADQLIDALIVDPKSHFVYALTEVIGTVIDPSTGCESTQQTLTAYDLTSDGKLQPINSSLKTVDSGSCPDSSETTITRLVGFTQDSSNTFLWLTQTITGRGIDTASILSVPIASNGTLGTLKTSSIPNDPASDASVTLADRSVIAGQYLVTAQDHTEAFADTVATFHLSNGDAALATQCPGSIPACHFVAAMAASPDGKFIYTVSQPGSSWQINALALDPTTGALAPIGNPIPLPQNAIATPTQDEDIWPPLASVDDKGGFLFVARNGDGIITTVAIDDKTGMLGTAVDSAAGSTPNAIRSAMK